MRPSARKNIQREIKRSESPCSESNNHRTTDAGAQSMSLAHYIEDGKSRGNGLAPTWADGRLVNFRSGFCRQLALAALEVLCAHVRATSPGFRELSESKNDTRGVAEAVLASVGIAEEPGGQCIRRTEVGAQVIDLSDTNREVATQADVNASAKGHRERGRAGHAARYSANDGKADSATEIRKSLPEQSMTKDGGPTEARRGCWAEQKVVHALIGGD